MITISIEKLYEAIGEAESFGLPDMSAGAQYLYGYIYQKLLRDEQIRLSEIDFDAFTPDDLTSLRDLHENVFEKNEMTAYGIKTELQKMQPSFDHAAYV